MLAGAAHSPFTDSMRRCRPIVIDQFTPSTRVPLSISEKVTVRAVRRKPPHKTMKEIL